MGIDIVLENLAEQTYSKVKRKYSNYFIKTMSVLSTIDNGSRIQKAKSLKSPVWVNNNKVVKFSGDTPDLRDCKQHLNAILNIILDIKNGKTVNVIRPKIKFSPVTTKCTLLKSSVVLNEYKIYSKHLSDTIDLATSIIDILSEDLFNDRTNEYKLDSVNVLYELSKIFVIILRHLMQTKSFYAIVLGNMEDK
jgi:hypothetical protein